MDRVLRILNRSGLTLTLMVVVGVSPSNSEPVLPSGFALESVVSDPAGTQPAGFAFLPDGRILIIEKTGAVRLAAEGAGTSIVIQTIPNVQGGFERGLLGVAIDPDWPTRPYAYFFYSKTDSLSYVTMYTASGDLQDPGSTSLTLSAPFHMLADIPDETNHHNGGTLRFGPDGMLYVSLGDDGRRCTAQDLSALRGKILRLDVSEMPASGSGPPPKADITPIDNPFPGPDENERLVFAWGLRNPFRFTIDPETGDLFVGDVGRGAFEEVDLVTFGGGAGPNFGWPLREGPDVSATGDSCGAGNLLVEPIYSYAHDPKALHSIIAGPLCRFVPEAAQAFPPSYDGSFFFLEFFGGFLRRLIEGPTGWSVAPPVSGQPSDENWAEGLDGMSDIQMGPDGAIYLLKISNGILLKGLYRIVRTLPTDVDERWQVASTVDVRVYPNPSRSGNDTGFYLSSTRTGPIVLQILDVSGRTVATLVDRLSVRGTLSAHWDGRAGDGSQLPAGVYFYQVRTASGTAGAGKFVLLR